MDKIKQALGLVIGHRNKLAFAMSIVALLELGYIYGHALMDGKIDEQERQQIHDASQNVVESLP